MGPGGNILENPSTSTFQQGLTHSAMSEWSFICSRFNRNEANGVPPKSGVSKNRYPEERMQGAATLLLYNSYKSALIEWDLNYFPPIFQTLRDDWLADSLTTVALFFFTFFTAAHGVNTCLYILSFPSP